MRNKILFKDLDFFKDDFPLEVEAFIFAHIIHNFEEETIIMLFKKAFKALGNNQGYAIVVDYFIDEERNNLIPLLFSFGI
jgi:hypothetical protein